MTRERKTPVEVLMVAINGYGHYYLKTLLEEVPSEKAVLAGVVDPEAEKSGYINWIKDNNIPIFNSVEEFFKNGHNAELTVISSPPQYHVEQAIIALKWGSNVLIDKPVGVGEDSVRELIRISEESKRWVDIGYQWSFSRPIQELKKDILSGMYGNPVSGKAICLWPRDLEYYSRNSWAGRIGDNDGNLVLDSPANNACAHFLHNLLFLLGEEMDTSTFPSEIFCRKHRAFDIESFDTISLKVNTNSGEELLFYASHATENARDPEFAMEFDEGIVSYKTREDGIIGETTDGQVKNYGSPDNDDQFNKLLHSIDLCKNEGALICPPEAALAHTICIDMIHSDKIDILNFNPDKIIDDGKRRYLPGLNEMIDQAYNQGSMTLDFKL